MMNNAGARLARRTGGFGVITTSFNVPRLWSGAFIQTASRSVGARQGRKVSDKSEASSVLKTYYCKLVIERKLILVNLWINLNRIVKVCNNMLFPCVVSDVFFWTLGFSFCCKIELPTIFGWKILSEDGVFFVFSLELRWRWIKGKTTTNMFGTSWPWTQLEAQSTWHF